MFLTQINSLISCVFVTYKSQYRIEDIKEKSNPLISYKTVVISKKGESIAIDVVFPCKSTQLNSRKFDDRKRRGCSLVENILSQPAGRLFSPDIGHNGQSKGKGGSHGPAGDDVSVTHHLVSQIVAVAHFVRETGV